MYKYDIPYPKKDQYVLLFCTDGKSWNDALINMSKNVSYLKTKMKAHRDEMIESGYDDIGYYSFTQNHGDEFRIGKRFRPILA